MAVWEVLTVDSEDRLSGSSEGGVKIQDPFPVVSRVGNQLLRFGIDHEIEHFQYHVGDQRWGRSSFSITEKISLRPLIVISALPKMRRSTSPLAVLTGRVFK